MAISLVSKPADWARVWDTNRMTYTFSSTNYTQPNFQYQFSLIYWQYDGTQVNIGSFNLYPNQSGTVEFNPSTIYRNYLSYNYDASKTTLQEATLGASKFSLTVWEYYGTPPVRKATGQWAGEVGANQPFKVYNGCQQNIPYDYTTLNASGNLKWVMSGVTSGQFLTDATEYRLSNKDIAFLWFNADSVNRPAKIRYKIFYFSSGTANPDSLTPYLGMSGTLNNTENTDQPTPKIQPEYNLDWGGGVTPVNPPITIVSAITYDTTPSYTYANTLQYYFPMGPYQLIKSGLLTQTTSWIYYQVDILTSGNVVLNKSPFNVYNTCKSDKFGKWSLCWLNPHGGFDFYTFDAKNEVNYKMKKDTYKQKLSPNPSFSTYEAGERVFKSNVEQEITLKSSSLTQKESQLLVQLTQSPRVYVNTLYKYNNSEYYYGVPVIISTDAVQYEQKKNNKEIFMEVKIRYANDIIIQND